MQPIAPGDTDAVIRLSAKIGWAWSVPADPALEGHDLKQEAILAGLKARDSWDANGTYPLHVHVVLRVTSRLKRISALADPQRRTWCQVRKEGDPRRERVQRFSEIEDEWEPVSAPVDCLTLMQNAFLEAAIEKLEPITRLLVRAALYEGQAVRATAEELGISPDQAFRKRREGLSSLWRLLTGERPAPPPDRTAWRQPFLAALAAGATEEDACRAAGISKKSARTAKRRAGGFSAAWEQARAEAAR